MTFHEIANQRTGTLHQQKSSFLISQISHADWRERDTDDCSPFTGENVNRSLGSGNLNRSRSQPSSSSDCRHRPMQRPGPSLVILIRPPTALIPIPVRQLALPAAGARTRTLVTFRNSRPNIREAAISTPSQQPESGRRTGHQRYGLHVPLFACDGRQLVSLFLCCGNAIFLNWPALAPDYARELATEFAE